MKFRRGGGDGVVVVWFGVTTPALPNPKLVPIGMEGRLVYSLVWASALWNI
jgi:hypothetical protein